MTIPIPFNIALTGIFLLLLLAPIFLILAWFRRTTRNKKSPLNIQLLRSPGQSLKDKISELTLDIIVNLLFIPIIALILYATYLTYQVYAPGKISWVMTYGFPVTVVGCIVLTIIKTLKMFNYRNRLRLGYDCELAVGQDLTGLISKGFKIYHDFPAEGFNIDHIAIGPTGVFAIETKGRSKQVKIEKGSWELTFDGKTLKFPDWTETKPITQAMDQARWLNLWLSSATGEPQKVTPVLAIPGWYIKRTQTSKLLIYNGKKSEFLANGKKVLSEKRIQAISHQVENKCRDVENTSYRKE